MQLDSAPSDAIVVSGDLTPELTAALRQAGHLACDTETTGLDWHTEKIGLIQLFSAGTGPILIQVSSKPPQRLISILEEKSVTKVFHYAPFDLNFLYATWGVNASSILCTKIASKILDPTAPNAEHSLQYLHKRYLGIDVTKGAVRTSDWASPSLTREQIQYASADVLGLLDLLDALRDRLDTEGKAELYEHCCSFLPSNTQIVVGNYPDVFAY